MSQEVGIEIVGSNQPVSGSSDPGSSNIDFGALKAQAAAMMGDDDPAPVEKEAPPIADPTQVRVKGVSEPGQVPAPVVETKVEAPVVAVPADLSDDTLVRVTVDGEEQILPWGEAKGKISGGLKFTKNMQTLAKERTEFAASQADLDRLKQERANLNAFLGDEKAIAGFVKKQYPHLFQQPAAAASEEYNPDEIATVGQARSIAEQQAQAIGEQIANVKTFVQDTITASNQAIANQQASARHAIAINTTLADIYAKNPVLNSIPNSQDLIRFEVSKLYTPQMTEPEALEAFQQVAAGMVEEIGKHFKANQKLQVVAAAKAKLESKTIEPAGGASPQLQPTSFKNSDGQVDWNKVSKAARDML